MEKILLVEDNGSLSKIIKDKLEEKGHSVVRAYSYNSALDCLQEHNGRFDAMIIDLQIEPEGIELDIIDKYENYYGLAVIEEINKSNNYSDRIVVYSAYADTLRRKMRSGAHSCAKDIKLIQKDKDSISTLLVYVETILKKS